MNDETYETLKRLVRTTRILITDKFAKRKRLSQAEVWEQATIIRDIKDVEMWIGETEKEHIE